MSQLPVSNWINPSDFSIPVAKSDNDLTSNWQKLFDQMGPGIGVVFHTKGRSIITAPIRIWGKQENFVTTDRRSFFPDAPFGFDYRGPEGTPAFQIYNTFGLSWKGVKVFINQDGKRRQGGLDVDQIPHGVARDGLVVPDGTCSDNDFEGFCVRSEGNSADAYCIRWAYTSKENVENQRARRVSGIFNESMWDVTSFDRGRTFKVGGGAKDAGANAKSFKFTDCGSVGAAHAYEVFGGASLSIIGGETNASTVDIATESSVVNVLGVRSENSRQFFVGGGIINMVGNELAGAQAWNPAYPLVVLRGRSSLDWRPESVDQRKGIVTIGVADPKIDQVSFTGDGASGNWADQPPDWNQFIRGAACTNPVDGVALLIGGGAPGYGMALKFASGTLISSLWNRDFGDGTMLYVSDARPGCSDLLHDPSAHGKGALAMKLGGRWQTFAI